MSDPILTVVLCALAVAAFNEWCRAYRRSQVAELEAEVEALSVALEDAEEDLEAAHEELEAWAADAAGDELAPRDIIAAMNGWIRGYTIGYREGCTYRLHS